VHDGIPYGDDAKYFENVLNAACSGVSPTAILSLRGGICHRDDAI
jgi:hypothetical protein